MKIPQLEPARFSSTFHFHFVYYWLSGKGLKHFKTDLKLTWAKTVWGDDRSKAWRAGWRWWNVPEGTFPEFPLRFASHIHWWEKLTGKKKPVQKNNKPTKQTNKAKVIGTTLCQNIFDNTEKTFQWHLLHIFKCNDAMLFWNLLWASIVDSVLATMLAPSFFLVGDVYLSWEEADCHSDDNTAWKLFYLKNLSHLSCLAML